jgi:predicted PhzF superfamily epimerase YddE/YHI9
MAYLFNLHSRRTALARFFFPQGAAILEDPATGMRSDIFVGGDVLELGKGTVNVD